MATLLVTLVILTTITFITIYTSRTVLMEQKIATNDFRGRMAFEAAESGSEMAMAYVAGGRDMDNDGLLPCAPQFLADATLCGDYDDDEFIFDTDNDTVPDSNILTLPDGSQVSIALSAQNSGDLIITRITAVGVSDDRAATRTITNTIALLSPLPNVPENPLITRGTVVINGSATVHNLEGNSTIWSGGDVDLGSNNSTGTEIASPQSLDYPDCLGNSADPCDPAAASDRYIASLDIIEYDTSLSNLSEAEFFENFFGFDPATYKATRTDDVIAAANIGDIDLVTKKVIWVEGNVAINGLTVGCSVPVTGNATTCPDNPVEPVILIIDGNLNLSGGPHFFGMVYVMGDINVSGNSTFVGSVVSQGTNTDTSGSLDIWYNSDLLESLQQEGRPAGGGGSWRDF
jgi:hypothetical protein